MLEKIVDKEEEVTGLV